MDYKNINDYEQLYLIAENDDEANSIIYQKYKPIVYSIAYKLLKDVSKYGVELDELIQEGFIGVSKAIKSYKNNMGANFYTFVTVCVDRQIKSYCRKFKTKKNIALSNKVSIDNYIDDCNFQIQEDILSNNNPEVYFDNSNYNDICIKFKHTLSTRASLVFELKCNGFKNKEICSLLEITPSMLERTVYEIRKKGKNYLIC